MTTLLQHIIALRNDRRGVTALEYGIIASVLAVSLVTVFQGLTGHLTTLFNSIFTSL